MKLFIPAKAPALAAQQSTRKRGEASSRTVHTMARILRPAPSTGLPALDTALDNGAMTAYLRPLLAPIVHPERPLTVVNHELLDYKPSKRGLIRYELAAATGGAPLIVFGKLFADTSQLARVDQVLHLLWDKVFGGDPHCSTPQPIGQIPALTMLLYLPAEGQFLDEVLTGERAPYAMELTARWLSTLHRHPLRLTKQFDLANELANLELWAALVAQNYPELETLAQQALRYLQQQARQLPFSTQTPIHKDFHYRHVLVERGVKVIDFDELRLGDPNFDLAHFCANLHLLAYRQQGTPHGFRILEQRFLDTYARHTGWSRQPAHADRAKFAYFYVYTCLKVARQLCLGVGPGPLPTGEARRRQVQMILNQALVAMQLIGNCPVLPESTQDLATTYRLQWEPNPR